MPRTEVFNREIVLTKVRDLFWNKGYNGTSMQDLVETTGLNRSSLYNSFGNKQSLYEMVLKKYQEDSKSLFQDALLRAGNPSEAIRNIFENALENMIKDVDQKGCFSLNCKAELSRTGGTVRSLLEHNEAGSLKLFKNLVQEGQDHEVINNENTAEDYAYYLYSAFQGLRMTGMLINDRSKLQKIIDTTVEKLN
ncbi:MAG: TetR/AcrR family transcriptional repressor of nem operon [Flavobacteriales bacterium]|jgi:TetR/AcrR family transcriptional repressor of nem operon